MSYLQIYKKITNLSIFKQSNLKCIYIKWPNYVIYSNFEKAFDRVNYKLLKLKLQVHGFCDPLVSWFESFLTKRTKFFKYDNFISGNIDVVSGVPPYYHYYFYFL